MIYDVHVGIVVELGGWPNYVNAVFHVNASSQEEAEKKAAKVLRQSGYQYDPPRVEFAGREYEVSANEDLRFWGRNYFRNEIQTVKVFPRSMTVYIAYRKEGGTGREDSDTFGVWQQQEDFEAAVQELLSKVSSTEV